jgi:vanillate/3-O-methylgallate O-demethylase
MGVDVRSMRTTPEGHFTSRWGLPEYTDWQDESMSWKQTCYLGDWSFLWTRRFRGPDVLRLFSDHSINSFASFAVGQSKHVVHCNTDGKVIHEGILSRTGENEYLLFGRGTFLMDYYLRKGGYDASSEELDYHVLQVSGPTAVDVVEKASGESLRDIRFMHSRPITIAGREVRALRQGMAGEIGFELQGPRAHTDEIAEAILTAGREFGIRRLGGRAVFINHLEACFPTIITDYVPAIFSDDMAEYREEFLAAMPAASATFNIAGSFESDDVSDWYRSPVELGWGRSIKFDHDFTGRAALEIETAAPRRVMRTLVWNAEDVGDVYLSLFRRGQPYDYMEIPRDQRGFAYNDQVLLGDDLVGIATSRGYSYYFRQMLSLAVIDVAHSNIGTEVDVLWGNPGSPQKRIRATVAPAPYKQDNRRSDLTAPDRHLEAAP